MRVLFVQRDAISELLGLCNLSACLKGQGHDCDLLLLTHTKDWLAEIRNLNPDLIGFSTYTGMQDGIFSLIRQVKGRFEIPVIVGGPHATFYPKETMTECPEIDMLCRGEGEETLLKLTNAMRDKRDYRDIPGLWVRREGKIIDNSISPLIKDIDSLPLPDRSIYYKFAFLRDLPLKRFISGYGCPYNCSYCTEPFFQQEYAKLYSVSRSAFVRYKSVDRLIEEILSVKENYRLKRVHFSNDIFSPRPSWLREFADKYPRMVGAPFSCAMRFDLIDKEGASLLKKSMCYAIQLGVESGNDRLRNEVLGKKLSRERILRASGILHEKGIKVFATNIIGLPGETIEDAIETVKLNQQLKADYVRLFTLKPFPGTTIANYAIEHGYLPPNYGLKDMNISDASHIHCSTPFLNEFKNMIYLFVLFVKWPFLTRFIRRIIALKDNALFRAVGLLNLYRDVRYFRIDYWSGIRFYFNTLFRLKGSDGMCWIPRIKKR